MMGNKTSKPSSKDNIDSSHIKRNTHNRDKIKQNDNHDENQKHKPFEDKPVEQSKSLSLLLSKTLIRLDVPLNVQTLIVALVYGDLNSKFLINLSIDSSPNNILIQNIPVYPFYSGICLQTILYKSNVFPRIPSPIRKGEGWILVSNDKYQRVVADNKTLEEQSLIFYSNCTIKGIVGHHPAVLYIHTLTGNIITIEPHETNGGMGATVLNIKQIIEQKEDHMPSQNQILFWAGKKLDDKKTLSEYNMEWRCTLYVIMKIGN